MTGDPHTCPLHDEREHEELDPNSHSWLQTRHGKSELNGQWSRQTRRNEARLNWQEPTGLVAVEQFRSGLSLTLSD